MPRPTFICPVPSNRLSRKFFNEAEMPIVQQPEYGEFIFYQTILSLDSEVKSSSALFGNKTKKPIYKRNPLKFCESKKLEVVKMRHGDPPNFYGNPKLT